MIMMQQGWSRSITGKVVKNRQGFIHWQTRHFIAGHGQGNSNSESLHRDTAGPVMTMAAQRWHKWPIVEPQFWPEEDHFWLELQDQMSMAMWQWEREQEKGESLEANKPNHAMVKRFNHHVPSQTKCWVKMAVGFELWFLACLSQLNSHTESALNLTHSTTLIASVDDHTEVLWKIMHKSCHNAKWQTELTFHCDSFGVINPLSTTASNQ